MNFPRDRSGSAVRAARFATNYDDEAEVAQL